MDPALQLNVAFAHFPYGGNGASSSEHPDVRQWEVETVLKIKADNRIRHFCTRDYSDTPIPMTRNRAIREAKQIGAHLLLMIDSDQSPNKHAGEGWFKPFWDEAFNFIYERYAKGLITVVGAPYCGPPDGGENMYVFQWGAKGNRCQHETIYSLDQYSREHAAMMSGIQECAALPTGLILLDLRAADLVEPTGRPQVAVLRDLYARKITPEEARKQLKEGYFYYEWKDQFAAEKSSTEDVTFTRDIALCGMEQLGYNPIFCAWDSWIGHHKPWNVGKPMRVTTENINAAYHRAYEKGARGDEKIVNLQLPDWARAIAEQQERNPHNRVREAIEKANGAKANGKEATNGAEAV